MTDTDTEHVDEAQAVIAWRALVLCRAGYDSDMAFALAERPDVDLHTAVFLLESGCPMQTAIEILT